jgi:hypothetical protein
MERKLKPHHFGTSAVFGNGWTSRRCLTDYAQIATRLPEAWR